MSLSNHDFVNFYGNNILLQFFVSEFVARYILPYLKEETKTNPLVVRYISSFVWVQCFVYTRMGYINPNSLPKSAWNCVSRVDPAVSIEDILGNVFSKYAINRIADVLTSCHNYTEA